MRVASNGWVIYGSVPVESTGVLTYDEAAPNSPTQLRDTWSTPFGCIITHSPLPSQ